MERGISLLKKIFDIFFCKFKKIIRKSKGFILRDFRN